MLQYQHDFVEFLIEQQVLLFGDYTLKSGRNSPYFFNAGQFNTARALSKLGQFYADAIVNANIDYDMLFGPAYKGIPIVSSVAIALYEKHGVDVPFCFNRKEAKSHGEGGNLIGAPLQGRVLLIDDVVSAGTTFRESADLINQSPGKLVALVTAMDRQEKGTGSISAISEIEQDYGIHVTNIIKLQHVIDYLEGKSGYEGVLTKILNYQKTYAATA